MPDSTVVHGYGLAAMYVGAQEVILVWEQSLFSQTVVWLVSLPWTKAVVPLPLT